MNQAEELRPKRAQKAAVAVAVNQAEERRPGKGLFVAEHRPFAQAPLEFERVAHEQGEELIWKRLEVLVLSLGTRSSNPMESPGEATRSLTRSRARWNDPSRDET